MAELRLTMTREARTVLSDLLRLIAPAASRVSVNRANVPSTDEEIAGFWVETLTAQASEEARLLAVAFASAKGDPAVIVLPNAAQAHAFLRSLSAVRMALRDLVFADITDAQLESSEDIDDESLPTEKRHALACYACFGLLQQSLISQLCPEAFD
jgi:hypothetical protein